MAAVLNAQLTAMLTALDGVAAGLGNEFVAHVGSTMAMAAAMPADWFPKTGTRLSLDLTACLSECMPLSVTATACASSLAFAVHLVLQPHSLTAPLADSLPLAGHGHVHARPVRDGCHRDRVVDGRTYNGPP